MASAKVYDIVQAYALLKAYGFKYQATYNDSTTRTRIEVWRSTDRKPAYIHVLDDRNVFFLKPLTSHPNTLKYLREL
jgi:hypothetical protein